MLDERALDGLGAWLAHEWWEQAQQFGTAWVALLAGRAALYVGEYQEGIDRLRTARTTMLGPRSARRPPRLGSLPRALLEAEPARARLVLAKAREALQDDTGALREVDAAIAVGFTLGDDLEVQALQLKSRVLELVGSPADAATCLVALARALGARGRYTEAVAPLERAVESFDHGAPQPRWQLADMCRLAARLDRAPFIEVDELRRARAVADEEFELRPLPERADAWAFCVDALIENDLSALSKTPAYHRARALVAAERALALDRDSVDAWAVAGECARKLGLHVTASALVEHAVELDDSNVLACQGLISLHSSVQSAQVRKLIDRHRHALHGYEAALFALQGELRLRERDYPAARRQLDRACKQDPDRPFIRLNRGFAALLDGDEDAARSDFERVRTVTLPVTPDRKERAWALWLLGDADEAERDFEILREDTGTTALEGITGLGCCAADRDDRTAVAAFDEAIARLPHRGDAARLSMLLAVAEHRLDGEALARVSTARAGADARAQELPSSPATGPEQSLAELRDLGGADDPANPAWVASRLALGRLAADGRRWQDAAEHYGELAAFDDSVLPEVRGLRSRCLRRSSAEEQRRGNVPAVESLQAELGALGSSGPWEQASSIAESLVVAEQQDAARDRLLQLVNAVDAPSPPDSDAAARAGDLLLRLGERHGSELAYVAGLQVATGPMERAELLARLAVAAALREDVVESRQWLLEAVRSFVSAADESLVGALLDICEHVTPEDDRPQLDTVVRALLEDRALTGSCRRLLTAARSQVLRDRYAAPRLPAVIPVAVAIVRDAPPATPAHSWPSAWSTPSFRRSATV